MFNFLVGLIVGVTFSVEITNLVMSTGIIQEIQQQWTRYQITQEDRE